LTALTLTNYVSTNLLTREKGEHDFYLNLPVGKVVKDNVFIISFPAAFDDFNYRTSYGCTLVREGDPTSTSFAASKCDVLNGRKARLVVT
jgi:hypothetical protein